jgi:hypothetical protein
VVQGGFGVCAAPGLKGTLVCRRRRARSRNIRCCCLAPSSSRPKAGVVRLRRDSSWWTSAAKPCSRYGALTPLVFPSSRSQPVLVMSEIGLLYAVSWEKAKWWMLSLQCERLHARALVTERELGSQCNMLGEAVV